MTDQRTSVDRHKGPRMMDSGAGKRKRLKEQAVRNKKLLSQTRRMTDFIEVHESHAANASVSKSVDTVVHDHSAPECGEAMTVDDETKQFQLPRPTDNVDIVTCPTESVACATSDAGKHGIDIIDIGLWPPVVDREVAEFWIKHGTDDLQNCDKNLFDKHSFKQKGTSNGKTWFRKCSLSMFQRQNRNGEIVKRSWLCFSPYSGKLFCSACKVIMSSSAGTSQIQLIQGGFCDWKHANIRLAEHDTAKYHLDAVVGLARRARELGVIESDMIKQVAEVENYWRQVLRRVISVIQFLCERGLALRGSNEDIGSPSNGNYLGLLELVAEYDDFLKHHIQKHANHGSGHTNYLSSTICDELVEQMGQHVLLEITTRIKESRYYSISLDSTPDEGHVDQLTLVFRYMEKGNPVERFVKFMPNQGHKAQDMFDGLMDFLDNNGLDLAHCRGQSYDNAAAMSGRYNGLQAKVMERNNHAAWIPCAGHSLNLVCQAAAGCSHVAVDFFSLLEEIYVFFTASTHRYELLKQRSITIPKRINTTRWSCRADATKAMAQGYSQFMEALDEIADDTDEQADVRCRAHGLSQRLGHLETGIYTVFWNEILERVNATSKLLQDPGLDINSAVVMINSLKVFIESKRDSFEDYEKAGMEMSGTKEYMLIKRRRRNVRLVPLDEPRHSSPETEMTQSEKFRVEHFLRVIDQFVMALQHRLSAYDLISSRFGFLRKINVLSPQQILTAASDLVKVYKDDLDICFGNELLQFADILVSFSDEQTGQMSTEHFMYQLLLQKRLQDSFPNVEIALRMYLVLMVSNCSAERSFSKLKLIKNRLRTSTNDNRLSNLALMSIESDILREIDYEDLVSKFAKKKSRRVSLQ